MTVNSLLNLEKMRFPDGFVIHDPDGSLLKRHGKKFHRKGYAVKSLNLSKPMRSIRYNPFLKINGDDGIEKLAAAVLSGTKGLGTPGDANFVSREALLFTALIGYVHYEVLTDDHNFNSILFMLEKMNRDEEWHKTVVDYMFEITEETAPEHFAVRKYRAFREAAGQNEPQIIASCIARLVPLTACVFAM
jgi:type IV secretion system protein VirD4